MLGVTARDSRDIGSSVVGLLDERRLGLIIDSDCTAVDGGTLVICPVKGTEVVWHCGKKRGVEVVFVLDNKSMMVESGVEDKGIRLRYV